MIRYTLSSCSFFLGPLTLATPVDNVRLFVQNQICFEEAKIAQDSTSRMRTEDENNLLLWKLLLILIETEGEVNS